MLRNLRKLRMEHHISQQALAAAVNVSQQSINRYENHNIEPDISTLIRLADYFDTSIDYLVGRTVVRTSFHNLCSDTTGDDQMHLTSYRSLSSRQKEVVDLLIQSYLEHC